MTSWISLVSLPLLLALDDILLQISLSRSCSYDLLDAPLDDILIFAVTYAHSFLSATKIRAKRLTLMNLATYAFIVWSSYCNSRNFFLISRFADAWKNLAWNATTNVSKIRSSWCLTSLACQHILATLVNWIYITSTRFSFGILAAFKRVFISTIHCSTFNGPSVLENTDSYNLWKSDAIPFLSNSLDCIILSSNIA